MQFVHRVRPNWDYECNKHLRLSCNNSSIWIVAHLYCVPGLCLLALGWHRQMPGYNHFFYSMRPEIQQQESKYMLGMNDQMLGIYTLLCRFYFGIYWVYIKVSFHLQIVIDKIVIFTDVDVNWSIVCMILLFPQMNISVVWTIAHLCCVIGPCLRALE